jgi:hypothetical protein
MHFGDNDPWTCGGCERLASYPLLLLEQGYSIRVQFNAACRLDPGRAMPGKWRFAHRDAT